MKKALPALLATLTACASARYDYDYAKEPDPRQSEYVIGVADSLSIRVWKNPELSAEVTVRPDGTITVPLIGDLHADGLTPSQLKTVLVRQLAKYVRDESAVVTIAVTGVNSYSFTVIGNVTTPGVFTSRKYVTVLEAMQLAGGPNRFASPKETRLLRRNRGGELRTIPINYSAIIDGTQPQANLVLLPGDQIYVP